MKRSQLRKSGLRKGIPLHYVDMEKEHITFRGKYPSVMNIPNIMKAYPDYTYGIIPWNDFNEEYNIQDS